jgi:hypothetical protein
MQGEAQSRRRVYVVEQQAFDYTPAQAYGDTVFMDVQRLAPDAPGAGHDWNTKVLQQIRTALSQYVPEYDFLIPTGSPMKLLAAGAALKEKGPRHYVLGWDPRTQRYLQYVVVV